MARSLLEMLSHLPPALPLPHSYYNSLGKTLRAVVKYLTYAAFLGLRIQVDLSHWAEEIARGHAPVFGGNWTSQLDAITTVVQAFKEHPGVLSWYITGEQVQVG